MHGVVIWLLCFSDFLVSLFIGVCFFSPQALHPLNFLQLQLKFLNSPWWFILRLQLCKWLVTQLSSYILPLIFHTLHTRIGTCFKRGLVFHDKVLTNRLIKLVVLFVYCCRGKFKDFCELLQCFCLGNRSVFQAL